MLEDTYMGMVIATFMYAMQERALMDEFEKLRRPCEQWLDCQLLSTSWLHVDFMMPNGLPVNEQHDPSIDWNARPEMNSCG